MQTLEPMLKQAIMVANAFNFSTGEIETGSWRFVGQPSLAFLNKMKYVTCRMTLRLPSDLQYNVMHENPNVCMYTQKKKILSYE